MRWITVDRALSYPTLEAIQADLSPITQSTTIHELKGIASNNLYSMPASNESLIMPESRLELFLSSSPISSTSLSMTVNDLGLTGTTDKPLNIFVVPRRDSDDIETHQHTIWGFESSDRGIATFSTCLDVLIRDLNCKPSVFRRMLNVLFQVTHFPPALEALHTLVYNNRFIPKAVLILATCFRGLALRMVPGRLVTGRVNSVLEGSRQIFAWLYDMCGSVGWELDDPQCALVREVQFVEVNENTLDYLATAGMYLSDVVV